MRSPLMLSAAMALLLAVPAQAATTSASTAHKGSVATGEKIAKGETVDQRIASLHKELQITSDEEDKWNAVAQVMHDNAAAMDKMVEDKKANSDSMTAKDDLATYQAFAQAHVDGLKALRDAFDDLYDSMPADQQKVADDVFAKAKRQ